MRVTGTCFLAYEPLPVHLAMQRPLTPTPVSSCPMAIAIFTDDRLDFGRAWSGVVGMRADVKG